MRPGIDDPAWNAAAGEVIRGLDEAIGLLLRAGRPPRRGGPGRQRPRVRPLPGPGPRQPDPDRRGRRPAARARRAGSRVGREQARDHLRLWGAKRDDPTARSSSFDLSVAAQFPFDWKRTLAFAPHQDTAAMVYLNSTAAPRRAPRCRRPARSTRPAPPPRRRWPRPATPRPAQPLFPQIIADRRGLRHRPGPRGLSRPDRPARRALLGPHQARPARPGSSPTRTSPARTAPRGSSPSPAPASPPGRTSSRPARRHARRPEPPRPADPRPHRGQADRRLARPRRRCPVSVPARTAPIARHLDGPHRQPSSSTRPRSRRSSSSGWPTSATWNDRSGPDAATPVRPPEGWRVS